MTRRRLAAAAAVMLAAAALLLAVPGSATAGRYHRPRPSPSPTPTPTPTPTGTDPGTCCVNRPAQAASIVWADPGQTGPAVAYAHPGGLVVAGRDNYADPAFAQVSAGGGTVLEYLDTIVWNDWGRYHALLFDNSACGPAVPTWGGYKANSTGPLADFRQGGTEQAKLRCVLETMVAENPGMGGWFADDLGSRSWFPDLNWATFPEQQAWRDGAIAIAQTFRQVADEHHLIFIVNGTWGAGTLAAAGGGYPDMNQPGLSLADGGYVEHHDGEIAYWAPYGCSAQWASASTVTRGTAFMYAVTNTAAGQAEFVNSGCYAYVNTQPTSAYDYAPPWGAFHPTGLPSHTS